jgi:hypothetical protein
MMQWLVPMHHPEQPTQDIPQPLLDDETRQKLPPLYSQEQIGLDAKAQVKFFTPDSSWSWYASEGSPVDADGYFDTDKEKVDFLFFGLVDGLELELGYFSLSELQAARGPLGLPIERDLDFEPTSLRDLKAFHEQHRRQSGGGGGGGGSAENDVDRIVALKDELLARLGQLPPEHQATIGLVMVNTIMQGEWGDWFRNALAAKVGEPNSASIPSFFNVSRDDLRRVEVSEENIDLLSDTDLMTIASLVHEHYITDGIWDEIAFITDIVLAGKQGRQDSALSTPVATPPTITPQNENGSPDQPIPVSWLTREDLLHARPDLKDKIAALGSADLARLADKVSDALQETYLLALGIVLDT